MSNREVETRHSGIYGGESRATTKEDGTVGIAGSAAVYNRTAPIGDFDERIAPGAFDEALKESDIRGLFNHDANFVLGRTASGTMTVRSGEDGLEYDIPDLPKSRADVAEAIQRGDVSGNSFSFTVAEDGDTWERQENGRPLRTIVKFERLFDVGPVTYPAYEATRVSARSADKAREVSVPVELGPTVDVKAERERLRLAEAA